MPQNLRRPPWILGTLWFAGCITPPLVPPTVDEDPTLPAIDANGSRFHVETTGAATGAPILFLAGGPGNDPVYLSRLGEPCGDLDLGRAHPLVWWDQRGTGQSRRHDDDVLNLPTFEADLDAVVDVIDPEHTGVILVGHSWGGMYATSYVNRHPDRVRAMVLVEPGEYSKAIWDRWSARSGTDDGFRIDFGAEWLNDFAWSSQILSLHDHEALDYAALMAVHGSQPDRVNREEAPNHRLGGAVIRASFRGDFYTDDYDFTTNLAAWPTEVLVVAGDTPTSDLGVDFQEFQLDTFPNATLEVIPGAGHTDTVWADACTTLGFIDAYFARVGVDR